MAIAEYKVSLGACKTIEIQIQALTPATHYQNSTLSDAGASDRWAIWRVQKRKTLEHDLAICREKARETRQKAIAEEGRKNACTKLLATALHAAGVSRQKAAEELATNLDLRAREK